MTYFFELITKNIGFSRKGRIILSKKLKKFILTPNIIIPMRSLLINNLSFLEQFEDHHVFLITKEIFLKIGFLRDKFKNTGFFFSHYGTLREFIEIFNRNLEKFNEDNVIPLIPFNIPTTSLSKEFAKNEIIIYLNKVRNLLKKNPTINFGLTVRVFDFPDLIDLYFELINTFPNITALNFADLFDFFGKSRRIIKVLIDVKQSLDNNLVIIASGRIIPKFYPLLIYLGVDLIDSSYLLYLSSENFYDSIEHQIPIYKVKDFPCSCVVCSGNLRNFSQDKYSSAKLEYLTLHNIISANTYMNKTKQYLNTEDFRAFVEKSTLDDLNLISSLRILDREYFQILRYETPILQENQVIKCLGPSSYYRPDFQEFRTRVIKEFSPELWTKLIILLPCSAKKPYSESVSHKKFQGVLRRFPDFPDFQEIILTSPLGAIPRQLENIYPANSYDISVTGDWDQEEINITAEMLTKLLSKYNEKIPILCHLYQEGYMKIIDEVKKQTDHKFYFTDVTENLTSKESLDSLSNLINLHKDNFAPSKPLPENRNFLSTWTRKLIKVIDYQFGLGSGARLFENGIKIRKRNSSSKIEIYDLKTKKRLSLFNPKYGSIDLTLIGANKLLPPKNDGKYIVFDGNLIKGSTLFRPGVLNISINLFPEENVLILNNSMNDVIGLGKLKVSPSFIRNSNSGKIVDIYEKIK